MDRKIESDQKESRVDRQIELIDRQIDRVDRKLEIERNREIERRR